VGEGKGEGEVEGEDKGEGEGVYGRYVCGRNNKRDKEQDRKQARV